MSTTVTAGAIRDGFRLSAHQRALFSEVTAGAWPFWVQTAVAVPSEADADRVREALHAAVAAREALRTSFFRLPALTLPLQAVGATGVDWEGTFDLPPGTDARVGGSALDALAARMRARPLDFDAAPVVRAALATSDGEAPVLLVGAPAVCADVRTMQALAQEVAAALSGAPPVAPPGEDAGPVQFLDVSEWHNDLLESPEWAEGRAFWDARVAAAGEPARLPFDRGPGAGPFDPRVRRRVLSDPCATGLEAVAAAHGGSTAGVLLACWQLLLSRWTESPGVAIACAHEARGYDELRDVAGPVAVDLPLHARVDASAAFSDLAAAAHALLEEVAGWEEYFSWNPLAGRGGDAPGLRTYGFEVVGERTPGPVRHLWVCPAPFVVRLCCTRLPQGMELALYHDAARVDADDADRLLEALEAVAQRAAAAPHRPAGSLEAVGAAERARLLEGLHATGIVPGGGCVHERSEAHARRTPDRVAVVHGDERLTYAELDAWAERLAGRLRMHGVGRESLVALYLERSAGVVAAILGVMKSGGAYLPLEHGWPPARIARVLETARPAAIVTDAASGPALADAGVPIVVLEDASSSGEAPAAVGGPPRAASSPESLAYVVFTSGSTGAPKGVAVEHRQLAAYVDGILHRLPDGTTSFGLASTFAADLGHTAVYPALCMGGTLHVIAEDVLMDAARFTAYVREHEIHCVKAVPSHLRALRAASDGPLILARRALVIGGEALDPTLVEQLRPAGAGAAVLNHYGPTETTVGALLHPVADPASHPAGTGTVPIGRPLPGVRAYLLDAYLNPVPAGVAAELYVGGGGVARGYLYLPQETAARFLPDPFSPVPGARMYRTGDRVRLTGGEVEFLGRADRQVKVRGHRVELDEIERVLERHPGVRAAAVVEDARGSELQIAAFVVPRAAAADGAAVADAARSYLGEQLPAAMLPARIVALPELPLTPNGKVDRAALAARQDAEAAREVCPPRDAVEGVLAGAWAEVLEGGPIGVHDNFYEVGGHSLLAIKVIARVRQLLDVEISLREFFQAPTVAEQAALAAAREAVPGRTAQVAEMLMRVSELSPDALREALDEHRREGEAAS